MKEINQRIARDLGHDLALLLADELSGSDLHSLLLSVIKRKAARIDPAQLTRPSPVTKACDLDARLFNKLEAVAYETASAFAAVELSPVATLGAVTTLTGLDQANVLSTVRAFECSADPTVGLAMECSKRRKSLENRQNVLRLCTNHRVLRFPMPTNPAYTSHFKLFSLVTAGRDTGSFSFELSALCEQIDCYLNLLKNLQRCALGFTFKNIVVEISDTRIVAQLCQAFNIDRAEIRALVRARDSESSARILQEYQRVWPKEVNQAEELGNDLPKHLQIQLNLLLQNVIGNLAAAHTDVEFKLNLHRLTGLGYYEGPCFHLKLKNLQDMSFMLADGGFVNWTQLMLADNKERLLTSAIGTELICRMFVGNHENG